MIREDVLIVLRKYFPLLFSVDGEFLKSQAADIIMNRLTRIDKDPLTCTQLNQLLHIAGAAGLSEGVFRFYFETAAEDHPYAANKLLSEPLETNVGIRSLRQIRWSLHRFFADALLYFGDLGNAYRGLRTKTFPEIQQFFAGKIYDSVGMSGRGTVLPFHAIPADDRYLIAELACKAYSPVGDGTRLLIEETLYQAYRQMGGGRPRIKDLFGQESKLAKSDPQAQMMLEFTADEFAEETVSSEEEIHEKVEGVAKRFTRARELAILNTRLYLSMVNELDVYVATSMRRRSDFREMSRDTAVIFDHESLRKLRLRYFDPTISAAEGHEDKGLVECLMVKCAKALVYFAGESDSFGKDAEVSMALSLGKPVVILCPTTEKGIQRMKVFQEIHPLSRLIQMETGIPVGAMITNNTSATATLLSRIFNNSMEYDLDLSEDGYIRLRERLTASVVRLQTNYPLLRESFSNYYHQIG